MVEREAQISEGTKLPLKLVALVLGAVVSSVLWLQACLLGLGSRIDSLKGDVTRLSDSISHAGSDRWNGSDMKVWASLLKANNPAIVVPDVTPSGVR